MLDTLAGTADRGDSAAAAPHGRVDDAVRELLLGDAAGRKACAGCGAVRPVRRWVVEVTLDGDRIGYVGHCPVCDRRDAHRIVDRLPHG